MMHHRHHDAPCAVGSPPLQVGKWLDMKGWLAGGSRHRSLLREKRSRPSDFDHSGPGGVVAPAGTVKAVRTDDEPEPWVRMRSGDFTAVRVKWSGDRCAVCSSEVDYDTDQLIHCHSCGIAVHQSCYGVRKLPRPEDKWVCCACECVQRGLPRPHCAVCPVDGGALKATTIPDIWCHVACMQVRLPPAPACPVRRMCSPLTSSHVQPSHVQSRLSVTTRPCAVGGTGIFQRCSGLHAPGTCPSRHWPRTHRWASLYLTPNRHACVVQWIPELGVVETETMEPIHGLESIGKDRWNLNCSVCKQRVGAKVQCSKCYTAFHPLCGRVRGLTMDMLENPDGHHLPLITVLHCHKHCTPKPGAFGVQPRCAST
jgi:hypothetical protein